MKLITTPYRLNLRGDAPLGKITGTMPQGTIVTRLGALDDGSWIYCTSGHYGAGWVSAAHVEAVPLHVDPLWLELAKGEEGVAELPGRGNNERIVYYHSFTSLKATQDRVPWCASFACWCLEQARVPSPRSAAARDFLKWGRPIEKPEIGCIVVLKRGAPPAGHVGFYLGESPLGHGVELLGGNQGDAVTRRWYPKADVLGYRMPNA